MRMLNRTTLHLTCYIVTRDVVTISRRQPHCSLCNSIFRFDTAALLIHAPVELSFHPTVTITIVARSTVLPLALYKPAGLSSIAARLSRPFLRVSARCLHDANSEHTSTKPVRAVEFTPWSGARGSSPSASREADEDNSKRETKGKRNRKAARLLQDKALVARAIDAVLRQGKGESSLGGIQAEEIKKPEVLAARVQGNATHKSEYFAGLLAGRPQGRARNPQRARVGRGQGDKVIKKTPTSVRRLPSEKPLKVRIRKIGAVSIRQVQSYVPIRTPEEFYTESESTLFINADRKAREREERIMQVSATGAERQHFYFQFITTPTADTPGTILLLHFNNRRYLFGQVAEGTQRAMNEQGVSLKKSRSIFLTGETRWKYNGGLLGMVLTMADQVAEATPDERAGMGMIRIYGGPKLFHTIACARRFIFRTGMPLRVQVTEPARWSPDAALEYSDDNVNVWALPSTSSKARRPSQTLPNLRSSSPDTLDREQHLRAKTVRDMFDSDWKKDRLVETVFSQVSLPAMVWVRNPESKDLQATFCTTMADAPHLMPDQNVFVRTPWPAALIDELPAADNLPSSLAMSYVVKGHPQRGEFLPQKAKDLGLKPGPLYGKLARGEAVTLDDGTIVKPEDVVAPTEPGRGAAILDVPAESYLSDLSDKLLLLQQAQILSGVDVFVWILGDNVIRSEEFILLKARFPGIDHIISSPDTSPVNLTMDSAAVSAARLNQIRSSCFPLPLYNNNEPQYNKRFFGRANLQAQRMLSLRFAPKFELNRDEVPIKLNLDNPSQFSRPEIQELVPAAQPPDEIQSGPYDNVQITTLGTGSAMPSKYRNVSANLVDIPSLGYFLFDAGENTLGQMKRAFNAQKLESILCNLHMIWISHLHADHHLGTISILLACKQAREQRAQKGEPVSHNLYLVSEPAMARYLQDYSSVEDTGCVVLKCYDSSLTDMNDRPVLLDETTLPLRQLQTTRVRHCQGAQAVAVTFKDGFKLSYSGDCRPSTAFAQIGVDSDVLIHEATFDDGMEGDAKAKKHSTIGEALGVASAMKAKNVILTHFSQRYQKLPTLKNIKFPDKFHSEEGEDGADPRDPLEDNDQAHPINSALAAIDESKRPSSSRPRTPTLGREATSLTEAAEKMAVCVAFDLMKVTIPQIKDMHKYYPAMARMYESYEQASADKKAEERKVFEDARQKQAEARAEARREKQQALSKHSKRKPDVDGGGNSTELLTPEHKSTVQPQSTDFEKGHKKKKSKTRHVTIE